jgi:hypothetical protein
VSAGASLPFKVAATVDRDLSRLAPAFRRAVEAAIAECRANGLDAFVYEASRSPGLAKLYYARGRTIKPPTKTVTNAPDETFTWHGYRLAVDVLSRARLWDAGDEWFAKVAVIFKRHGLKWGGDWKRKDLPHFQWGKCKPSPSARARELLATEGHTGVWRAVGAAA